jgi:2'-5' RNA ligase
VLAEALTSHWARSTWAPGERRLHWYVLPPDSVHPAVDRTQHAVTRPELTAVPGRWLHCTIIAMRDSSTLSTSDREAILQAGTEAVADIAVFDTSAGVPAVWGEAVVFDLSPCAGLELLHRRLTDTVEPYLHGPKPTRFVPHITFAYCHDAGESESTTTTLLDPQLHIPPFRVDRVRLLDVLQEPGPASGWYSWDVVGSIELTNR